MGQRRRACVALLHRAERQCLSRLSELLWVQRQLNLHPLAIEDAEVAHQPFLQFANGHARDCIFGRVNAGLGPHPSFT